jgi:hypothetical protein
MDEERHPRPEQPSPRSWADDMREHYYRTGTVRPADVIRVLGDTSQAIRGESRPAEGSHNAAIAHYPPIPPHLP